MSHHIKNYDPPLVTAKFYILLVGKRVQVGECGWYKSESVGGTSRRVWVVITQNLSLSRLSI